MKNVLSVAAMIVTGFSAVVSASEASTVALGAGIEVVSVNASDALMMGGKLLVGSGSEMVAIVDTNKDHQIPSYYLLETQAGQSYRLELSGRDTVTLVNTKGGATQVVQPEIYPAGAPTRWSY
ncbi:hypothetical protein [Ferrimonas pelagia]|uniref:Uncharacterized protein n=1 Tax=Ferrimonas pelagia TaxID=1177826 RepID=A0ABP9EV25_9GAMM